MTNQTKRLYRIRNWPQYNKALVSRGSLTLRFDSRSINTWLNQNRPACPGRRRTYTDAAIICALLIREVYHLPLRSTQGLVHSLLRLMHLELPSPHYSTLSRRARSLELSLPSPKKISHLVIDSTGLKLYGEGEWKVRLHGADKRRTWRKFHLAVDAQRQQLTAALITEKELLDRNALAELLVQADSQIEVVCADGAYDFEQCYRAIKKQGARALIPPRSDAIIRGKVGLNKEMRI